MGLDLFVCHCTCRESQKRVMFCMSSGPACTEYVEASEVLMFYNGFEHDKDERESYISATLEMPACSY